MATAEEISRQQWMSFFDSLSRLQQDERLALDPMTARADIEGPKGRVS